MLYISYCTQATIRTVNSAYFEDNKECQDLLSNHIPRTHFELTRPIEIIKAESHDE